MNGSWWPAIIGITILVAATVAMMVRWFLPRPAGRADIPRGLLLAYIIGPTALMLIAGLMVVLLGEWHWVIFIPFALAVALQVLRAYRVGDRAEQTTASRTDAASQDLRHGGTNKKGNSMVGFEILVNGKRLYTIGVGDFGVMQASVMHARVQTNAGPIYDEVLVHGQGHSSDNPEGRRAFAWDREMLKIGDEVTIRVIETDSFDPGESPDDLARSQN